MNSNFRWRRVPALLLALIAFAALLAFGWNRLNTRQESWRLDFEHTAFGPVSILATIETSPLGRLDLRSTSAALVELQALPATRTAPVAIDDAIWAFRLRRNGTDYAGESVASRAGDPIVLSRAASALLRGSIGKGWFQGSFTGVPHAGLRPLRDYPAVVARLRAVTEASLFDPSQAPLPRLREHLDLLSRVAAVSLDDVDLLLAHRFGWATEPAFSHFELRRSNQDADSLARQFDAMSVGGQPVRVEYRGDIAVLTVATMMGHDTYALIESSMRSIAAKRCRALVIDLRGNRGGAFAVGPLIEPLLSEPYTAGVFLSRRGRALFPQGPDQQAIAGAKAWRGRSLVEFWREVQAEPLLRIDLQPAQPHFGGKVVVLVDGKTESAAELAAQALQASGRATVVGERSAGRMLSGAYFDLGQGFQVFLPIADYFASRDGRIEGRGVTPEVETTSEAAMESALAILAR